jgi:UDP-N-acetylmuramoyl-tripeptide--D-alanyl-D-alanine ligase
LGDDAARLHAELGSYARSKNIKKLFTLGVLSENATQTFGANAAHFHQRDALIAALKAVANSQTTFLIKGSRSAKMELVVRELCDLAGDTH